MPTHLRPTAPIAADAVLVGDPGRALLLAQELLEEPKMSNHARGLWGYSGRTPAGDELTIQATGIGGPSATLVLGELAELGLRRAVRVGTCVAGDNGELGRLLVVTAAIAEGGSVASLGVAVGETARPDAGLTERLEAALAGVGRSLVVGSVDTHPGDRTPGLGADATDMQTAPLLARGRSLGIALAAVLIVAETNGGVALDEEQLKTAEKRAGQAASSVLST